MKICVRKDPTKPSGERGKVVVRGLGDRDPDGDKGEMELSLMDGRNAGQATHLDGKALGEFNKAVALSKV